MYYEIYKWCSFYCVSIIKMKGYQRSVCVCDSVCTFEFEFQILNELSVRIRRWQALYWNYGGMGGVYYQN